MKVSHVQPAAVTPVGATEMRYGVMYTTPRMLGVFVRSENHWVCFRTGMSTFEVLDLTNSPSNFVELPKGTSFTFTQE